MAFLFQDQNQGTRNETAPHQGAAAATVLFHPDCNRRLRNRTESADPSPWEEKALAGLGDFTLTAGGDFHPALRTSAARYERPEANYDGSRSPEQAPSPSKSACPHEPEARLARGIPHVPRSEVNDCGEPTQREHETGARTRKARIRFRFVPVVNHYGSDELWTSAALSVDGLGVRLRGFRKSHHLIRAGPDPFGGFAGAATRRPESAC